MNERELETEQYCNILTPTLLAITAFFLVLLGCSTGGLGPSLSGTWSSIQYLISNSSDFQTLWSPKTNWLPVFTELYNSSTPTQYLHITGHRNMHFRRLWNGMADRHQAEIIVMQFKSHYLPVHQFIAVPWDFTPVPYCQPSSPTPLEYALPPSLEWHV